MSAAATGDCFPVAYRYVCEHPDRSLRLCHGTMTGQGPIAGLRHAHAWVEETTVQHVPLADGSGTLPVALVMAIDHSNGKTTELPAGMFRNIGDATDVTEYSLHDAMRLALTSGHYGPWENT